MEDAGSIRPANGCSMNYTAWAYTIGLEGVDRSPSGGKVRRSWYHTDFGHNREGLTTRQIAKNLGISKSAVDHVCQYFRKHRRVEKLPLPRIFNSNDLKYLEVLLKERVDWYLYELQSEWDFGCEEV
ncbi:unnamed protein product [Rhizophagus irregularis]|nr:unnamed protein product [Rhizophagus irregularis]